VGLSAGEIIAAEMLIGGGIGSLYLMPERLAHQRHHSRPRLYRHHRSPTAQAIGQRITRGIPLI
jgi:chromosome condensin MukBEF MukE localization factor